MDRQGALYHRQMPGIVPYLRHTLGTHWVQCSTTGTHQAQSSTTGTHWAWVIGFSTAVTISTTQGKNSLSHLSITEKQKACLRMTKTRFCFVFIAYFVMLSKKATYSPCICPLPGQYVCIIAKWKRPAGQEQLLIQRLLDKSGVYFCCVFWL